MQKKRNNDPDKRRAKGGWKHPIRIDGEVEGQVTVWDFENEKEDTMESLVLCEYLDGEISAYIEKEGE